MNQLWNTIEVSFRQLFGFDPLTVHRLLLSFLVIFVFLVIRKLFDFYASRRIEDANKRHMAAKTMHYLAALVSLVII